MSLFLFFPLVLIYPQSQYTLRVGDTLFQVSKQAGVPVPVLLSYNAVQDAKNLRPGTVVKIPQSYKVNPGDTLWSLARVHGVRPEDLKRWNGLTSSQLRAGMTLYVPELRPPVTVATVEKPSEPSSNSPVSFLKPFEGAYATTEEPVPALIYSKKDQEFLCAGDGVVTYLGNSRQWGGLLLVDNSKGQIYGYAGSFKSLVSLGSVVSKGQALGILEGGRGDLRFFVYNQGMSLPLSELKR